MSPRTNKTTRDKELIELGLRIRAIREAKGETQESIADAAGLHWSYVGQIERGERNLTYKNLLKLANGLAVEPSRLMPS